MIPFLGYSMSYNSRQIVFKTDFSKPIMIELFIFFFLKLDNLSTIKESICIKEVPLFLYFIFL